MHRVTDKMTEHLGDVGQSGAHVGLTASDGPDGEGEKQAARAAIEKSTSDLNVECSTFLLVSIEVHVPIPASTYQSFRQCL